MKVKYLLAAFIGIILILGCFLIVSQVTIDQKENKIQELENTLEERSLDILKRQKRINILESKLKKCKFESI